VDIFLDGIQCFLVIFLGSHLQQLTRIEQGLGHVIQGQYDFFQPHPFAPKPLGALLVVPDLGVFQFADDLRQPFIFAIEVKGTP
jgi:hypothetical protein